jgi:hypothetical protein
MFYPLGFIACISGVTMLSFGLYAPQVTFGGNHITCL